MQVGDIIEVISYRGNPNVTIKIGHVDRIRNIHSEQLKLKTYKRNVITRSSKLITVKDKHGTYRSYYDSFLTARTISRTRKFVLRLMGY